MGRKFFTLAVLMIVLLGVLFSFVGQAKAATKSVTIRWTQEFKDPNSPNADYWTIYKQIEGYGYSELATVDFVGVQSIYSYTYDETFDNGVITVINYYVRMTNTEGTATTQSNEKTVTVDLTPDSPPVQLDPIVE